MLRRRILSETKVIPQGAVDLGLPSGLLWAEGNLVKGNKIGSPTDSYQTSLYVSWGNTDTHYCNSNNATFENSYSFGSSDTTSPYKDTQGAKLTTTNGTQAAYAPTSKYDVARKKLGGKWRMPTADDFTELINNTSRSRTTINRVAGVKFEKIGDPSVYIFFPYVGYGKNTTATNATGIGYYWTSSQMVSGATRKAYYFIVSSSTNVSPGIVSYGNKFYGAAIRPVQ